MRLLAISDLHLHYRLTRRALRELPPHPDDWLIVAGDVGHTDDHFSFAWRQLTGRFARVLWVPGNHDLWTQNAERDAGDDGSAGDDGDGGDGGGTLRGEALYRHRVEHCRAHGVLTPEDPFPRWPGPGPACRIAPLFTLYDYSFRPDEVPEERAVAWARASGVLCADERRLRPDPHPSRQAWCAERCRLSETRLAAAVADAPLVLVNHWPLRRDLPGRTPRFSIWSGTRASEDWHRRFGAVAAVYGHQHVRRSTTLDGCRFDEVSPSAARATGTPPAASSPTCARSCRRRRAEPTALGGRAAVEPVDEPAVEPAVGPAAHRAVEPAADPGRRSPRHSGAR